MKNPAKLLKLKRMWDGFATRHPKLLRYLAYVNDNYMEEGTLVDLTVTDAKGKALHSNAKLTAEDVEFINAVRAALESL